jgi:serine/threonine-protein kinase
MRYQSAFEMMTDLEMYIYSDRYGPTNEKLAVYIRDLYRKDNSSRSPIPQPPPSISSTLENQR